MREGDGGGVGEDKGREGVDSAEWGCEEPDIVRAVFVGVLLGGKRGEGKV